VRPGLGTGMKIGQGWALVWTLGRASTGLDTGLDTGMATGLQAGLGWAGLGFDGATYAAHLFSCVDGCCSM
jgi:hypothetical protein